MNAVSHSTPSEGAEARSAGPERTCAGCRQKASRDELVRFAVGNEPPYVVPDPSRRLGGRGASVHPKRDCLQKAIRKGGFARAAKRPVKLDEDAVLEALASHYQRRIESLIRQAAGRRMVAIGTDPVREAIRAGGVSLLVVAHDAAGRRQEIEDGARRLGAACLLVESKVALGALLGKREVGVLAILDSGFAKALDAAATTLRAVREDDE